MGRRKLYYRVQTPLHGGLDPEVAKAAYGIMCRDMPDLEAPDGVPCEEEWLSRARLFAQEAMMHPAYVRTMRRDPDWPCVLSVAEGMFDLVADCAERRTGKHIPRTGQFRRFLVSALKLKARQCNDV